MGKNLFLIHGAFCSRHSFNFIIKKVLDDLSVSRVYCFEYLIQSEPIESVVARAQVELTKITEKNGLETIVVGHSLGGLIGLRLSQQPNITKTITLSAPLSGLKYNIWLASLLSWHAPTLRELTPNSNFITALHHEDYSRNPIEVLVTTQGYNPMIPEPNDGVITIDAQTRWYPPGAKIVNCPINHNEVLQSAEALLAVERALQDKKELAFP